MSAGARALLVHADDLGLSDGVTAGILAAHRHGVVRSASLMTTTPGFTGAVALARQLPSLDLGLHLNLTTGRPCLSPERVPSLVSAGGRFHRLDAWLLRAARGRVAADETLAELTAQVERGLATGLRFSHLDGHHHIHLFAPATAATRELAERHGIAGIRLSDERRILGVSPVAAALLRVPPLGSAWRRQWLLHLASRRAARLLAGLVYADYFTGLPLTGGGLDAAQLNRLVATLPAGTTELMCHPGYGDESLARLDPGAAAREREIALLTNPALRDTLDRERIDVLSTRELVARRQRVTPPTPDVSHAARGTTG